MQVDTNNERSDVEMMGRMIALMESSVNAISHRLALAEQVMAQVQQAQILEQSAITHFQHELSKIDIRLKALGMRKATDQNQGGGSSGSNCLRP